MSALGIGGGADGKRRPASLNRWTGLNATVMGEANRCNWVRARRPKAPFPSGTEGAAWAIGRRRGLWSLVLPERFRDKKKPSLAHCWGWTRDEKAAPPCLDRACFGSAARGKAAPQLVPAGANAIRQKGQEADLRAITPAGIWVHATSFRMSSHMRSASSGVMNLRTTSDDRSVFGMPESISRCANR